MTQNRVTFDDLFRRAEQEWRGGNARSAAALAQAAANWAWHHHPGFFSSGRLEGLLLGISRDLYGCEAGGGPVASPESRSGVLHVLTEGYDVGGHTRLAARWIAGDTRVSSVVLTQQHRVEAPARLVEAVGASGGRTVDLSKMSADLIGRASVLRQLARRHEVVVLHIHPYDVVPLLALADMDVPVIFVNHADHVFWVGSGVSNAVMNFRHSGNALAAERRGLPASHLFVLPIPLKMASKERAPKSADRGTVALTIASEYKYGRGTVNEYINMLLNLLRRDESLRVIAIGPENKGLWAWANRVSGGRIQPLGIQRDIGVFYEQADLYLDSFPFASVTSLLEAAAYALPVVSLRSAEAFDVFSGDDPDLPAELISVASVPEFEDRVLFLSRHPQEAAAVGRELQARLLSGRSDAAWGEKLRKLYALAASAPRLGLPAPATVPPGKLDARLVKMQEESAAVPFDRIWLRSSETLTLPSRIRYFLAFSADGKKVSAASLFSEKQVAALLRWRRRIASFRLP